jgi:hypothetical protein
VVEASPVAGRRHRPELRRPVLGLLAGLWPVLWYSRTHELEALTRFLIPAFVLLVFATVLAWGSSPFAAAARLTKAAFGFVAVGDLFLNLTPWPAGSAPAFIGAHACLAAGFLKEQRFVRKDLPWLAPPAIAAFLFGRAEWPLVSGMGPVVALTLYLVALSAMLWRALCSVRSGGEGRRIAARISGATLFFATDLFAIATAVHHTRAYIPWIWAIYPPALLCLAWSTWRTIPASD